MFQGENLRLLRDPDLREDRPLCEDHVLVDMGSRVRAGELVATIESPETDHKQVTQKQRTRAGLA
jgi:hypothetical protein